MQWNMLFIKEGPVGPVVFTREALSLSVGTGQWDDLEIYASDGSTLIASVVPDSVHLTDEGLAGTIIIENEQFEADNRDKGPDDYTISFQIDPETDDEDDDKVIALRDVYTGIMESRP